MCVKACEECKIISRKLYEKPNSIEELAEQRDWMKQIPDQLKAHEVENFFFNKIVDYNNKWLNISFV